MRDSALGRNERGASATGVGKDDRRRRTRDCDQQEEENGPDPVARIPAQTLLPEPGEPAEDPAGGLQTVAALEAVLLVGAVRRPAPGTEGALGCAVRRGHCSQGSRAGSDSSNSARRSADSASPSGVGTTAWPQTAQNFASAATALPHCVQPTTGGVAATARPQLAQKCEPQTSGAPHAQRAAGAARRTETAAASSVSSS